jgi:hypothetical protein
LFSTTDSFLRNEQSISLACWSPDVIGGSELDLLVRYRRLLRRVALIDGEHHEATRQSDDDLLRRNTARPSPLSRSFRSVLNKNEKQKFRSFASRLERRANDIYL